MTCYYGMAYNPNFIYPDGFTHHNKTSSNCFGKILFFVYEDAVYYPNIKYADYDGIGERENVALQELETELRQITELL